MGPCPAKRHRPLLKYFGGKFPLCRQISDLFPAHESYHELFLGGGSVLRNKVPAAAEVGMDLDPRVINFWHVVRDRPGDLVEALESTPYTESRFERARQDLLAGLDDPVPAALAFMIVQRGSRAALGDDFAIGTRTRGGIPGDANSWKTIVAEVLPTSERVRAVDFRCGSAMDALPLLGAGAVAYLDPTYLPHTRVHRTAYAYEMSILDHVRLLNAARVTKAAVFLSGYRSSLYDTTLARWRRVEFDVANHSAQNHSKQRRIECVYTNT